MRGVRCDSGDEALLWVRWLTHAEPQPVQVSPLGCNLVEHAVVDPATRRITGHCRYQGLVLDKRILIIPQVSLLARNELWTCDAVVKCRKRWLNFEYDGPGHSDERDPQRAQSLDIPILRMTRADLISPRFVKDFIERVEGLCAGRS